MSFGMIKRVGCAVVRRLYHAAPHRRLRQYSPVDDISLSEPGWVANFWPFNGVCRN